MEDVDFPVDYKDEPLFDPSSHNQKTTRSRFVNPILLLQQRQIQKHQHAQAIQKRLEVVAEESLVRKELQQMKCNLPGNPRSTFLVVFSPDGSKVASTHGDHNIYVTDLRTGSCVSVLEGHPRTPWCIAFHPTSNDIIASGCLGGQVRVWDLHGGSEIWAVTSVEPSSVIASLAFHPTERLLVIAINNSLHFWDWSYSQPFAKCSTHTEREKVRYVNFDPHGKLLITGIANAPGHSLPNWTSSRLSTHAPAPRLSSALERERERHLHTRYQALLDQYERLRRRYQELRSRAAELEQNANADSSQRSFSPAPSEDLPPNLEPSIPTVSPAANVGDSAIPGPSSEPNNDSWDYTTPPRLNSSFASVAHWSRPWSRAMLAERASASGDPHAGDHSSSDRTSRPSLSGANSNARMGRGTGNYDFNVAAETSRLTTEFDARVGIRLLSRHIEYMQRICRVHLATARQHHQVIQLQQIRHILEDLQDQIRYLNVCVRDSIDFVANLRAFGELEGGNSRNNTNNRSSSSSASSTAPTLNTASAPSPLLTPASIIASVTNSLPVFSSLNTRAVVTPSSASSPVPGPGSPEGLSSPRENAPSTSAPTVDLRQQRRWPFCRHSCTCRGRLDRSRHVACQARHVTRPQRGLRGVSLPRLDETRTRIGVGDNSGRNSSVDASETATEESTSSSQSSRRSDLPSGGTTREAPSTPRYNPYPASRYQRYLHQLHRSNSPLASRLTLRLPARHRIGCGRRRSAETYTTSSPIRDASATAATAVFSVADTSRSETPRDRPVSGSQEFRPLMERLQSQLRQQRQSSSPITDPVSPNIWDQLRTEQPSTSAASRPLAVLRWSRDLLASIREWRRANRREVRSVRLPGRLRSTRSMDNYARFDEDSSDTDSDTNWHANRQTFSIPRPPPDYWSFTNTGEANRTFADSPPVSTAPTQEERDREARLERTAARERFRYRQLLTMMVDNLASFFSQHGIQAPEYSPRQQPQTSGGEGGEQSNSAAREASAGRGQRPGGGAPVFGFFAPANAEQPPWSEENRQSRVFAQRDPSFVILHSQMSANHRIQAWDFSRGFIPDITEGTVNIVVAESKIHNDASVDVSKDGLILATLVPCAVPFGAQISLHSLEENRLGQCLARLSLHQAVVSVSLSPTCKHLLVGLAASRVMPGSMESSLMAQMYTIPPSTTTESICDRCGPGPCIHGSAPRSLTKIRSVYLAEDQGIASLNCIRWATIPGQGIVLGTNKGQLKLLH